MDSISTRWADALRLLGDPPRACGDADAPLLELVLLCNEFERLVKQRDEAADGGFMVTRAKPT